MGKEGEGVGERTPYRAHCLAVLPRVGFFCTYIYIYGRYVCW